MVNNKDTKVSYKGNGQTTVFPFSFPFIKGEYIHVAIYDSLTDTTETLTKDYYVDTVAKTVNYPGYPPGQEPAEALRPPVLPSTSTITIFRETDIDQLTDLGEKYPLPDIEAMSDKLTEILQEQQETLERAVTVPIGDPATPEEKLTDLQNYVKAAADSAADAADSEASAQRAAEAAATSEANAAESERLAGGYADTATAAAGRAVDSAISARAYNAPEYDNETTYQAGDVVTYTDGNSYRALQETTGNEPPNIIYWQQVTDYVGDNFFEIDEYGYIVPMDSPSHSRYWRVDQNGYIVPIEGGDGGYRPDTRQLSAEYLNVTNEGYIKHLRADDIAAQEVDADEMTAEVAAFTTLTANAVNAQSASVTEISAGTVTANDIIAKGPVVDVRAFGAKGDGVTDDTAAFESAINAAENGILLIPHGAYKITDHLFTFNVKKVIDVGTYPSYMPFYPKDNFAGKVNDLLYPYPITFSAMSDTGYSNISNQGICVKRENGIATELYVFGNANDTVSEVVKFRRNIAADGYQTWEYVNSNYVNGLGHSESQTVMNGYIYALNSNTNTIYKIDTETLQIVDNSITLDAGSFAKIFYDEVAQLFGAFYIDDGYKLAFYDDNFAKIKTIDVADVNMHVMQNAGGYNGVLYVCGQYYNGEAGAYTYKNFIKCIDYLGNQLKTISVYNGAEIEGIDIDSTGYLYLSFNEYNTGRSKFTGAFECPISAQYENKYRTPINILYVNNTRSNETAKIYVNSPTDTRHFGVGLGYKDHPFNSIGAGCLAVQQIDKFSEDIQMSLIFMHTHAPNAWDYTLNLYGITKQLSISHATYDTYDKALAGDPPIGKAVINGCTNIDINCIKFYKSGTTVPLYVVKSNIIITNCIFGVDSGYNIAFQYTEVTFMGNIYIINGSWNIGFCSVYSVDSTVIQESNVTRNFFTGSNLFSRTI